MRPGISMAVCTAGIWMLVSTVAWCAEAAGEAGGWEAYAIVSERNIFSRARRPRSTAATQTAARTPAAPRPEQSYLVLRGVARGKDGVISFIEDSRTGEVKRVREGETIGGGSLGAATLDFVFYRLAGVDTRVEIGMTLEGKASETVSFQVFPGDGYYSGQGGFGIQQTTSTTVAPAVVSDDAAKDILERLKERRKKELGE